MKILIIDDEPLARSELRSLLSAHPGLAVVGEAGGVADALELTERHRPDVVFLDINLRGETGFDYVGALDGHTPRIVFVTAYDHHALRAFDCNALDYLLKPVRPARLADTVLRLQKPVSPPPRAAADDRVFLKASGHARFVPWSDIVLVSTEGNYTRVRFRDGSVALVLRTLKDWIARAPADTYAQVHRTTLVRLDWVSEIRRNGGDQELVLRDAGTLAIGRSYWPELKRLLGLGAEDPIRQ